MSDDHKKFKLGTADTVLLAVGTLAVDYICTSKFEVLEVMPGGKKQYSTIEELEEKIKRYGIKKGPFYPGSSIGNFISQAQLLTEVDPSYKNVHLATALAMHDPLAPILLDSLNQEGITYDITEFTDENAKNPTALLVESKYYTKILSFKDKRMPAIEVHTPKAGKPGVIIIGAAAGHTVDTKQNALNYSLEHNVPLGVLTTLGETNILSANKALKNIFSAILKHAAFFTCNEDEAKRILQVEKPGIKLPQDRIELVQELRHVFQNDKMDILMSFGADGSLALVGDHVVVQKIPDTPRDTIISAAGAGDTLAGAFIQGVRMKGMDLDGVLWSLPRANCAAQNVLQYADTRTGHFTAEQFLKEPPKEFTTEVIKI
jgi:sugar/nucleoside kinase (ribokinase family)